MRKIFSIKLYPAVGQFVKYVIANIIFIALFLIFFATLRESFSLFSQERELIAVFIALIAAIDVCFLFVRKRVFNTAGSAPRHLVLKFFIIYIVGLVIYGLTFLILTSAIYLHLPRYIGFSAAFTLATLWGFFTNKHWAFRYREATSPAPTTRSKRVFHILKLATFVIILLCGLGYGANEGYLGIYPPFPNHPKTTTLNCKYSGKDLKVDVVTHQNVNHYYTQHNYLLNTSYFAKNQFAKFIYQNDKDNTVDKLVSDIVAVGKANNLNDDQTLELATCFVQNIPYDDAKAEIVLNVTGNTADTEQYPYVTLSKNKGICTDKTYLGSIILNKLGYGTGIFSFNDDNHMALGISAPSGYTDFNTKYTYAEMTNPAFIPGDIPESINDNNGVPVLDITEVKPISASENPDTISVERKKALTAPRFVVDINSGKSYERIVQIKTLKQDIEKMYNQLADEKILLQKKYDNIMSLEKSQDQFYKNYLADPTEQKYNAYSEKYNQYKSTIDSYNGAIADYNKLLEKYNAAVKQYEGFYFNTLPE
ncbi:MAG: transglutaminase-like domain-containing protein [Patescibacteria group bacterium]|jgi:putative flippase GtrA